MLLKNQKVYFNLKNLCLSSFRSFAQSQTVKGEESHYDILGIKKNASLDDIKKAYRDLSKVHHPDVSQDPSSLEKFKKISNAYTVLKDSKARKDYDGGRTDYEQQTTNTYKYNSNKTQNTYWNDKQTGKAEKEWAQRNRSGLSEEEILYETIFGKTFKEDPLYYYKPENETLRSRYKEEMEKVYTKRKAEQGANYKGPGAASTASETDYSESAEWRDFMREFYQKRYEDQTGHESGDSGLGYKVEQPKVSSSSFKFISGFLLLATGGVVYALTAERNKTKSKYENIAQPLSSIQLEDLREQHLKREEAKKEQKKADFSSSLALMKKYPRKNPNAVSMLIDYTIWNDVKIYTVPYTYFHFEDEDLCRLTKDFEKNRIFNLKINTMLTYALEVERTFKNIYVKVDDVLDSLKKTGTFEPPGAFIRYYGYLFAKIRRKPIVWENLQQTINNGDKTISVFDLFFRYSTPILIANDEFYEIPIRHSGYVRDTTTSEGMGWIGNVHINHRPLEKKLFVPGEKNIFMWRGTKAVNAEEDRYLRTWGAYYEEYKKLKSTL